MKSRRRASVCWNAELTGQTCSQNSMKSRGGARRAAEALQRRREARPGVAAGGPHGHSPPVLQDIAALMRPHLWVQNAARYWRAVPADEVKCTQCT